MTTQAASNENIVAFHKQRRMLAIIDGEFHLAPVNDARDHKTWFSHNGWSKHIDDAVRGFVDPTGVYVYRGPHFFDPTFAERELAEHADLIDAPPQTPVWAGMKPGRPGERWQPIRSLGTLGDLLAQRWPVKADLRFRPETMRLLKTALGTEEAMARLIRRAVGHGAEAKVLALLQAECHPHDWKKIRSGQQSSELFECTRCDKQYWD